MTRQLLAVMAVFGVCAIVLTGCGRKGALEPPPSATIETDNGQRVEKPKEDRPFILDRLIQ